MKKLIIFLFLILAISLSAPLSAFAVGGFDDIDYDQGKGKDLTIFIDIMKKIGDWLFTFLLIFAVIMILIAGFKYLFSGGGENIQAANKMLIYAAVAVAVGVLASSIPWMIKTLILNQESPGSSLTPGQIQEGIDRDQSFIPAG